MNERKATYNDHYFRIVLVCAGLVLFASIIQGLQITSMREKEGYVESYGIVYEFYQDGSDAFYVQFTDEDKVYSFIRDETSEKLLHLSSGDLIRIYYSRNLFDPALRLNEIRKIKVVSIS